MAVIPSAKTIVEVEKFLGLNRQLYHDFLRELSAELERIKNSPECSRLIYRIYSRADKQLGDPFKKPWKIAEKLEKSPGAPHTVGDIIGFTVVVNFPSDRKLLAKRMQDQGFFREFRTYGLQEKDHGGYYAHHFQIKSSNLRYNVITCEVQVKTMLHDVWAAKTHDLTYKPEADFDARFETHMGILGKVLKLLDEQSEIIKDLIHDQWNFDKERKAIARKQLLVRICSEHEGPHSAEIRRIVSDIEKNPEAFSQNDVSEEPLEGTFRSIQGLIEKHGYGRDVCRLITLLASLREMGDLNIYAINEIDSWMHATQDQEEKGSAYLLRSLAQYAFGSFADAVDDGRRAVQFCETHGLRFAVNARMNLAYFVGEAHFHQPMKFGEDAGKEAQDLAREALDATSDDQKHKYLDTLGAIEIACGRTEEEIRTGLRRCQAALEAVDPQSRERPVAEAFFSLHERRAFRRLLGWR